MEDKQPKMAKGGTFAPADIKLIKEALYCYLQVNYEKIDHEEVSHISNLLHRLGRIG